MVQKVSLSLSLHIFPPLLLSSRSIWWIVYVPVFQKVEHYNESSPSVSHKTHSCDRKGEMPEFSLHIMKDATTFRILDELVDRARGSVFTERKELSKSREIFHVFVCVSVSTSSHIISHKSLHDYFLGSVVTRYGRICWGVLIRQTELDT